MDSEASAGYWIAYLDAVRSSPVWQQAKADSVDLLRLGPGQRGLDVGCGTGEEVAAMGELVGDGGAAVGVDLAKTMVGEAQSRHGSRDLPVWFSPADAGRLPFADGAFDACRVERTLQHSDDADAVVAEMARVLRPGGRLVAVEPDWDTLAFDTPLAHINRRIYRDVLDRAPSRVIGRRLSAVLGRAGMGGIEVRGWVVCFTTYAHAQRALTLEALAQASVRAGVVSQAEATSWLDSLRRADAEGAFFASLTMFTVSGTKA